MKQWAHYLGDGYEVVDILKESATGAVALLYDRIGKQVCVLKQRAIPSKAIYQKLKEMENPYIPSIYRLLERNGQLFIIEEFIDGRTLADILRYDGKLNEKKAIHVLQELCECLRPLHKEGIIHRDIKPSNIILTKSNSVKLIDFGIARMVKETDGADTELLGTKGYAPPEQYGFGQTDARSDIYSLGITIRRMLGSDYHGCLGKVLQRCTALDPENRYASVDELLQDAGHRQKQWRVRQWAAVLGIVLLLSAVSLSAVHEPMQETVPASQEAEVPFVERPTEPQISSSPSSNAPIQPNNMTTGQTETAPATTTEREEIPSHAVIEKLPAEKPNAVPWQYPQLNREHCTFFLNGAPCGTGIPIPAGLWKSWERDGDTIRFPADWSMTLHIDNQSASDVISPMLNCSFHGAEGQDWRSNAPIIPSGESADFDIPLGECRISGRLGWLGIRLEDNAGTSLYWEFQFYLE